jgi:hypothetical protein
MKPISGGKPVIPVVKLRNKIDKSVLGCGGQAKYTIYALKTFSTGEYYASR